MREDEGVTVTGSASVETVPDIVLASLGVDVRSEDLSTALRTAEDSLSRMREVFLEGGVERAGIGSTRSTIWREDNSDDTGRITTLMHVRLGLRVTLRDVAAAGDMVHAALAAADEHASMDSLDFAVADTTSLIAQARDAAFDDARAVAGAYAVRAGRELGRVVAIVEGGSGGVPVPRAKMAMMSAPGSMPVEPGEASVGASVTVTWSFAD